MNVLTVFCIGAVVSASLFMPTAAQPQSDSLVQSSSKAQLHLLAEYSTGFSVTVPAPQLTAQLASSPGVSCEQGLCQPCILQEALVVSNAAQLVAARENPQALPAAARCSPPAGFTAGVYSLQAGAVAGSQEARWACFTRGLNGSVTKLPPATINLDLGAKPGNSRPGNTTASDTTASAAAEASSNALQAASLTATRSSASYMVEFAPGSSYTCVAYYTPSGTAAAAPGGGTSLSAVTAPVAKASTAASSSAVSTAPTTQQDSAASVQQADTASAIAAFPVVNHTSVLVPAADSTQAADAAVLAAQVKSTANVTVSPSNSSSSTADISFSTTDMTTDVTTTTTVVINSTTADIIDYESEITAVCSPPAYKQPPRGRPAPPLAVSGNRVINARTRRPIFIHGINWFGFNVDLAMLNGLWAGGTDAATDFSKIAYQLRQLGFNAVRLPFVHNFIAKPEIWDAVRDCTTMSERDLKLRLIDPQDLSTRTKDKELPPNPSPMRNTVRGKCNTYLPARSNMDRFLFVIQQFIAQGMYVVLDYQPQGLEQHPYNLAQFVGAWKSVWKKVTCLPNFNSDIAGRVLIDVMNEPDSMGIKWESNGDRPGAELLYLSTAEALWRMTPKKMLFMFEGTGQTSFGLNWGNGFITDRDIIISRGLSDPTPFFQKLLRRPFVKNTVISPHLYPPSITKSTWLGQELWKQSNTSFSYLQDKGFCDAGRCMRFPIIIGETGSAFVEENDKIWLKDFASFVMARGRARAYNTIPLAGWMWWAFNENSGDTGGIVMNNWQDINWVKLRYMMDNLGLTPWYKQPSISLTRRSRSRSSSRPRSSSRVSSTYSSSSMGRSRGRRSSSRRQHRRNRDQQVTFDWAELGFDIGTLRPQATR